MKNVSELLYNIHAWLEKFLINLCIIKERTCIVIVTFYILLYSLILFILFDFVGVCSTDLHILSVNKKVFKPLRI